MSELTEGRLSDLVSVATRTATGYILRCLVERRHFAARGFRVEEYTKAEVAYGRFLGIVRVVLGSREKTGDVRREQCTSERWSRSSSRSRSRCAKRRARKSAVSSLRTGK
jgi:hypothetical protein